MSDEIKKDGTVGEENVSDDGEVEEELEQLRETFQEVYDETAAEAENGPVIQELDVAGGDEDAESESDENTDAVAAPVKKKKGIKVIIAVVVVIAVLIFGLLITYFVASVSNPNFNSLVGSIAKASSASTYTDKMSAYEEALGYCEGDSTMQKAMRTAIYDEMLKVTYTENGFAAAYELMNESFSEEEIAASTSSTVKMILKVIAAVDETADGSWDAVFAALDENADADAKTVMSKFSVPSEVADDIESAFEDEIAAVKALKEESGFPAVSSAVNYAGSAYSKFVSAGVEQQNFAEKMCVSFYKNGYIMAAVTLSSNYVNDDAEVINSGYSDMKADIESLASIDVSVYELAEKAVKAGDGDYAKTVAENTELEGAKAGLFADIVGVCADAIKEEQTKNLSKALNSFLSVYTIEDSIGISDGKVLYKAVYLMVESGNLGDLQSYNSLLTDEMTAELTDEEKAEVEKIHAIYNALAASSEVFSEYYMGYAYYGTAIDYEAACNDLDALITDSSTNYDRGFVAYCKYFAAMYSENEDDFDSLIGTMKKEMPDLKPIYGYYLIDLYRSQNKFDDALKIAQELLADNIGDDYANSIVAFVKRTDGDIDGALEAALKGIELSGVDGYCLTEAGIDYMIKEDYEDAFEYLKKMYDSTCTFESCELVLICEALYKGDNEEVKSGIAELSTEIKELYENYSVESYSDTLAVINGEKTLEDIYTSGEYALRNEEADE